jgi:hypothetical protein
MKNLLTLAVFAIAIGLCGTLEVSAQRKAKDLFTQYNDGNNSTVGAEGAKVSILLKRGNQPEKLVSPNETFYSGDKIKLVFDINFDGYAAIINVGPTGNESILFPYLDEGRIVDHSVSPNAAVKLPRGNAWINFDSKTGDEQVTVIFSKNPIAAMDSYQEAVTNGSDGRVATEAESDAILAELNSKSLGGKKSKDLFTQNEGDGTYCVAQNGIGNEPVAFTFTLKHK